MKINICRIDLNTDDGRQTIYWDTEDKMLHSDADPEAEIGYQCKTLEDAADTAYGLWLEDHWWHFEWVEYYVKPEYIDRWGYDVYTDTLLNASQIGAFCRGWEMDAEDVMFQLEEL